MTDASFRLPLQARLARTISSAFRNVATGWRAYVVVAFVVLCSSLPGIATIPVMDVDEARFAQASRQMLESGDYVRIRLQESERNRKPAGVHWLQAASTAALQPFTGQQNAIWTYRLPSVLGALMAALATLWAGRVLFGARTALLGASLLGAGLLFGFEGMTAKTDALMVGFTTLALAALANLRAAGSRARLNALVFWGALGCAIMIKGPVPLMIVALVLAALALWERRVAWMTPLAWWGGPALLLAIVLPWSIAIGLATEWRFYIMAFGQDLAPKLAGSDHAHAGFFGYHIAFLPLLMFPATFALPAAVRLLIGRKSSPEEASALRFVAAWAGATLLLFELSPGKLIHYAMPAYPAIALLCAAGVVAAVERQWRWTLRLGVALFAATGALFSVALWFGLNDLQMGGREALLAASSCGAIIGVGALAVMVAKSGVWKGAAAIASGLLLCVALRGAILPDVALLQTSARAAAAVGPLAEGRALWVVGYDEPSIVFVTSTTARLSDPGPAGRRARLGDAVIVERAQLDAFQRALTRRRLTFTAQAAPIDGLSMSSNDRITLIAGAVRAVDDADASAEAAPDQSRF